MSQKSGTSQQFDFECPLSSGLHARPASQLAEIAARWSSECSVTNLRNGLSANLKSVLGIIAADIRHGDRCAVHISGSDDLQAKAALRTFIENDLAECDVPLANVYARSQNAALPRSLQAANVRAISGIPVSHGIGRGKVVAMRRIRLPESIGATASRNPEDELFKVEESLIAVRQRMGEKLKSSLTPTGAAVLQADLAMAGDVVFIEKLKEHVVKGKSATEAVIDAGEFFINLLGNSENEYVRQRTVDIEEICSQLLEEIHPGATPTVAVELTEPSVVVAETLAPQQLLALDRRWLKAVILEHSAATSHAAILARSLGIPTLAGVGNNRIVLTAEREVLVDANRGFVIPEPSQPVIRFYEREQETLERRNAQLRSQRGSATTSDGVVVEVGANASSGEELAVAFEGGADGIGLFRTELLFLGRDDAPSEAEQYAIYLAAVKAAEGRPVIFRTFDIGGDKKAPYFKIPDEANPFLGYRGARIYGEYHELLQIQLRALLRASASGNVQIMAPLISSLEELVEFKSALAEAKHSLDNDRLSFNSEVKIGMMLEVPSVAFIIDQLCQEVDFFSIGTNDLSQYFFAADRGNVSVASLYGVRHPAFVRFLKHITDQARLAGKWVGMCGEMAADLRNLPLVLALRLNEISVPAAEIHKVKRAICTLRAVDCAIILERAITCKTISDVDDLLTARAVEPPEPLLTEDLVILDSASSTKEEVLQEMIDALYVSQRTDDRQLFEEALWARETVYSTGLGFGFATPHCKTNAIKADSICVLRLKQAINWDSVDGENVRMVVLLAVRDSNGSARHMHVFSNLARKLMNDDFRRSLLKFETPGEITSYLAAELGGGQT